MPAAGRYKWSKEKINSFLLARGFTLLSKRTGRAVDKIEVLCPRGHVFETSFHSFKNGNRCSTCSKKKKKTIEEVRRYFSKYNYTLLSKEYKNHHTHLEYICDEGHKNSMSWSNFQRGHRCPDCSNNKRKTLKQVKEEFQRNGYLLLSKNYINSSTHLKAVCPSKHEFTISWANFSSGYRCPACTGSQVNISKIKSSFRKEGYYFINTSAAGKDIKVYYICPEGHYGNIKWSYFAAGGRCSECCRYGKVPYEEVKRRFSAVGYTLLDREYPGNENLLKFKCDNGHLYKISLNNLDRGNRCALCSEWGWSKSEREIGNYFIDLGIRTELNTRAVIGPKELDIFFPNHNLAIEYCGLYWHSEVSGGKDRRYHYTKYAQCKEKGIRLITIFEDEYISKPRVVISRIRNALNIINKRVYARNCTVRKISKEEASSFLKDYHLQGVGRSSIRLGLFNDGVLVSVMTGSSLTRRHTSKLKTLELKRLCFLPGYSVVGGASKLFKHLVKFSLINGYEEIRSYQDMRWGNPFTTVYDKLGFNLLSETKYTPHYLDGYNKRIRNQSLRKTPEERLTGKTEWQLRQEQGYDRIWDCGHRTYVYRLKNTSY